MLPAHIGGNVIPFKLHNRERWNKEPLPPNEVLCSITGASGSGKSVFVLQLLPNIVPNKLKNIVVLSRIEGNEVYDAIEKWCKITDKNYKFSSDPNEAMEILEEIINNKKNDDHIAVIFDDWNEATKTDKHNPYNKISIEMFSKGRNYNIHSIFIVQKYTAIPTIIRVNLNLLIIFKMTDRNDKYAISKDFTSLTGVDDEIFQNLLKKIQKKHSYLLGTPDGIYMYIHNITNGLRKVSFD